ncbi:F0F1 ATP synthase subunit delta [Microlunatus panaciterrae]|uniref:ATP synthase subunit delta n=1 Tax=Microlunatus panaciterrae TaxID=400768 RepID=A0ABS2REI0_9ACTN|nr:F0F1 ATP synthase subunit delta [Microlunatus panaciterrae]MBM7797396.1 F-type H+-transporting ATPase subunit delta [Microlunatus panaciterrae]
MSQSEEARLSLLDHVLDGMPVSDQLARELFQVVDALSASAVLRRTLSDPAIREASRQGMTHALFDGKVGETAVQLVAEAAVQRWGGGRSFVDALERQAVRAQLKAARDRGQLVETEDELFRFGRMVEGDSALLAALSNRTVPLANRQALVEDLLRGRANDATVTLATRAVAARERNFANTLDGYVTLAADEQSRSIATVRVARPLTEEQSSRLQSVLSQQAGRDVVLQVIIDPDVLGGVRVELGDEAIEGTVASRLENARRLFG